MTGGGKKSTVPGVKLQDQGFFFFLKKERIKSTIAQRVPKCDTLKSLLGFFFFFFLILSAFREKCLVCVLFLFCFFAITSVCVPSSSLDEKRSGEMHAPTKSDNLSITGHTQGFSARSP